MFSAGRSDPKQSATGSRAWLKVGKSFQKAKKTEENEEEEDKGEFIPVAPKEAAIVKETKQIKIEKPQQYIPKPYVAPLKVDKLYEIDRGSDKDNLFYGTLNAIDVPRYHLNKRKARDPDDEDSLRYFDLKHKVSHMALHVRGLPQMKSRETFVSSFIALEPYVPIKDDDEHVMSENQRAEARIIAQNKHYNSSLRSDPSNVALWIEYMHIQCENLEYESAKAKAKHRALVLEKQLSIWQRAMAANPTSPELMELEWFLHMQRIDDNDIIQHLEQGATRFPDNESIWLLLLQRKQLQFSTFSVTALRDLYARILQTLQMRDYNTESKEASLTFFFTLLCELENASGYPERALSLLQAALGFNVNRPPQLTIEDYAAQWATDRPKWGEPGFSGWQLNKTPLPTVQEQPSMESYLSSIQKSLEETLEAAQPPLHLRDHPNHIAPENTSEDMDNAVTSEKSNPDEEGYVWSNVHGHRVRIKDAEEAAEYERILNELRSNQPIEARESSKKKKHKEDEDERLNFSPINDEDQHVHLLHEETLLMATQWRPLRPCDPEDAALIESQPDRVVLMDEIQPFLIKIGPKWQFELYISLLALLGVAPQDRSFNAVATIYEDAFAGSVMSMCKEYIDHDKPLNADSKLLKGILMDKLVISSTSLADPTRVEWIRRLFQQGYQQFTDSTARTLCLLWAIEFETKLGTQLNSIDSAAAFAKELLSLDASLPLYERYAYMELSFGNVKMAQRICDKTILSLSHSLDKHRFLYHRLQLEDNPWRSLYILYQAYYPKADSLHKAEKRLKKQKQSIDHILSLQMRQELMQQLADDVDAALVQVRQSGASTRLEVPVVAICLYHHLYAYCIIHGKSAILSKLHEGLAKLESLKAIAPQQNALERAHPGQTIREWFIASTLDFLATTNPSPREWREATLLAITTIPSQPVFAHLFVDAYKNNTMSQQVQRFIQNSIRSCMNKFDSPAPLLWQMALLKELYRVEKCAVHNCCARHAWGTVAIRRIRQLFEDALSHTSWRSEGNAALWRLYLRFELKVGQVDRAIKVLYRSIHKCPWSKALYLDSIKVLRPYVDNDTVQEILSWLVAKDIYLRYES